MQTGNMYHNKYGIVWQSLKGKVVEGYNVKGELRYIAYNVRLNTDQHFDRKHNAIEYIRREG